MNIDETMVFLVKRACKCHPKAKQYAQVNCEDNFCLAMSFDMNTVVTDEVIRRIDNDDMMDWWNKMSQFDGGTTKTKYQNLVLTTLREMYKLLRV